MQITKISRTFLPEIIAPGTGLSPTTERSIIPTNNVVTIEDILRGKQYKIPGGGGSWSSGWGKDLEQSFKDTIDDYKRKERDLEIITKMESYSPPFGSTEEWKAKVPGGTKTFASFEEFLEYKKKMKEKGIDVRWVARTKVAQNEVDFVSPSMESTFMVQSINPVESVIETGECFCIGRNYFITCAHVIKSYNKNTEKVLDLLDLQGKLTINIMRDNRKYKANLIAIDAPLDMAIIRSEVDCEPLLLAEEIIIGEDIFAIGSPHGFENNVTFGKISSENRKIYTHEGAPDYIFLDLSVFSGNSGGPAIRSSDGKVVAMVTAIVSPTGEYGLNAGLSSKYMEQFKKSVLKE